MSAEALREALAADPSDWVCRLALADALSEAGDEAGSRLERARAWLLAWAEAAGPLPLSAAEGRGTGPKLACFGDPMGEARAVWLCWRADRYDLPADLPADSEGDAEWGTAPWLSPGRGDHDPGSLVPVYHGASLLEFCAAVTRAGGWFLPDEPWG